MASPLTPSLPVKSMGWQAGSLITSHDWREESDGQTTESGRRESAPAGRRPGPRC